MTATVRAVTSSLSFSAPAVTFFPVSFRVQCGSEWRRQAVLREKCTGGNEPSLMGVLYYIFPAWWFSCLGLHLCPSLRLSHVSSTLRRQSRSLRTQITVSLRPLATHHHTTLPPWLLAPSTAARFSYSPRLCCSWCVWTPPRVAASDVLYLGRHDLQSCRRQDLLFKRPKRRCRSDIWNIWILSKHPRESRSLPISVTRVADIAGHVLIGFPVGFQLWMLVVEARIQHHRRQRRCDRSQICE